MATPATERPVALTVAMMVTRRCNMTCAHCSVVSGPAIRAQPSEGDLESLIAQAADAGVNGILFTGGEPMLRERLVLRLMSVAKARGLTTALSTNGFWGSTLPAARRKLSDLRKAGLGLCTLSYDRYHAEFQGPGPGQNILQAAEELGVPMNVNVTRVADDSEVSDMIRPFEKSKHAKIRLYDVQPVGRARDLPASSLRSESDGSCLSASLPAITDDGRLTACNGPSYFQPSTSSLNVGSLSESSLHTLLRKHRDDPILQTVRIFGPTRLRTELSKIPGFEKFPWKDSYAGLCDLCLHINSDAEASTALRERLSRTDLVAERTARRLVMEGVSARGKTGRLQAIGPGTAWIWMAGARGENRSDSARWVSHTERVLGRADADWRQMVDYISACGLSRVVLPLASDPAIARWAPALFHERLAADALREGRRELVQRRVLATLDDELRELGADGILLKGAAFLGREISSVGDNAQRWGSLARRGSGDIDILVRGPNAEALRDRLLQRGAEGHATAARTGPHHLAPVIIHGLPVEIHTRIMPSFWRLPEKAMLSRTQPLSAFGSLRTLDSEGMMLHAMMHCASHVFAYGLRTAWDVARLIEQNPALDVGRLKAWIDSCAMPTGFYLPARVMSEALEIPMPPELLSGGSKNPRFSVLERVLRQRLFVAMEGTWELNPITKHALFFMLHETTRGRVFHAASMFGKYERESRADASRKSTARGSLLLNQIRECTQQFWRYRELLAQARTQAADERAMQLFDVEPGAVRR